MSSPRDVFLDLLKNNRAGEQSGICSVCSSQKSVIRAGMAQAKVDDTVFLIESTSNQVDQYGGYTGMQPKDFVQYVHGIADEVGFPQNRVLLGGDHLGPNAWQNLSAKEAMDKSHVLIEEYVKAGYQKIHLDCSMFCADDKGDRHKPLADEITAGRAASLCDTAERTWKASGFSTPAPVYIIGTEVPIPGGAQEEEEEVIPTKPEDVDRTIEVAKQAFYDKGLEEAWERVVGVVVQPGVEFGDDQVFDYQPEKAQGLSRQIEKYPSMVYEAHSTDYQNAIGLSNLVRDHYCILKVGPWLTYAYREALFALEFIEQEVFRSSPDKHSNLRSTMEEVMLENPVYWKKYYPGTEEEQRYKRSFSFSDRCRYYLPNKKLKAATNVLFSNLREHGIPLSLLSQYLPREYRLVREGKIGTRPEQLAESRICSVLEIYSKACGF